jgi:hypothetical protein
VSRTLDLWSPPHYAFPRFLWNLKDIALLAGKSAGRQPDLFEEVGGVGPLGVLGESLFCGSALSPVKA